MIEKLGVKIKTNKTLGRDFTLSSMKEMGFEAVFVAVGAPKGAGLGMKGDEAAGVTEAIDFLRQYNLTGKVPVGKNVVVVGGGNAAIDAARTAIRLGASSVTVAYRRTRAEMPGLHGRGGGGRARGSEIPVPRFADGPHAREGEAGDGENAPHGAGRFRPDGPAQTRG